MKGNEMAHYTVGTLPTMDLALRMAEEEELRDIKRLATREQIVHSEKRADEIASGCFQWLAAAFTLPSKNAELLMFDGLVERFLRLIILDTRFFEHLRHTYARHPIHYKPLATKRENIQLFLGSIDWTIDYLNGAFGDTLDPELAKWKYDPGREPLPIGIAKR